MVPPQPAARPANAAITIMSVKRASTVSRNGKKNIPPNDTPVSTIPNIHTRILPKRRESGIHIGTEAVDGNM